MSYGYVYVLANPSMPGIVKIGMTTRSPKERSIELSDATGVPTPFLLVYYTDFCDCEKAEKAIHSILEKEGYRVAANREFFRLEIKDAIDFVINHRNSLDDCIDVKKKKNKANKNNNDIAYDLIKEGNNFLTGTEDVIQDHKMAMKRYKEAIKIGNIGYYMLGMMYCYGLGVKKANREKGEEWLKEGIRNKEWICAGGLWERGQGIVARQSLQLFLDNINNINDKEAISYYLEILLEKIDEKNTDYILLLKEHREDIKDNKDNIIKWCELRKTGFVFNIGEKSNDGHTSYRPASLFTFPYKFDKLSKKELEFINPVIDDNNKQVAVKKMEETILEILNE